MDIATRSGSVLTDAAVDRMAEACERGEYPGTPTREATVGRPLLFGEELRPVTFKETAQKIAAIDCRAASLDMSRSDYLRHLVDADLATA